MDIGASSRVTSIVPWGQPFPRLEKNLIEIKTPRANLAVYVQASDVDNAVGTLFRAIGVTNGALAEIARGRLTNAEPPGGGRGQLVLRARLAQCSAVQITVQADAAASPTGPTNPVIVAELWDGPDDDADSPTYNTLLANATYPELVSAVSSELVEVAWTNLSATNGYMFVVEPNTIVGPVFVAGPFYVAAGGTWDWTPKKPIRCGAGGGFTYYLSTSNTSAVGNLAWSATTILR